ncbi:hypothetical protein [Sphingomonas sp. KR3-1]|uniref:hypothetical protein n=1 Tax=Sphingomonas sp. KR3-1 TaxID=3156611 RepID=UPI0032B50259
MNSKRIQSAALAFAATVTLVAGAVAPASAAVNDPSKPAAKQEKSATADAKNDKRRYCVEGTVTGSRIPKRECHTRAEWVDLTGSDPTQER